MARPRPPTAQACTEGRDVLLSALSVPFEAIFPLPAAAAPCCMCIYSICGGLHATAMRRRRAVAADTCAYPPPAAGTSPQPPAAV